VTHVFIFREGPVQPDSAYLHEFLETPSPDVFENRPQITAVAVGQWPESLDFYVIAYLLSSGLDKDAIQRSESGTIVDDSGTRVHLVKIYGTK
jgi:hypothetical protein